MASFSLGSCIYTVAAKSKEGRKLDNDLMQSIPMALTTGIDKLSLGELQLASTSNESRNQSIGGRYHPKWCAL
jgi:hypothetical protein